MGDGIGEEREGMLVFNNSLFFTSAVAGVCKYFRLAKL